MKILSIDWDYFFPSMAEYDWGMREEAFFYELVWNHRYFDTGIVNRKPAHEVMVPKYDGFFRRILSRSDIKRIVIVDSHKDLSMLIKAFDIEELWNFDQHHDLGYGRDEKLIHCGNWAKSLGDLSRYHLVYPKWRKEHPEHCFHTGFGIYYDMPPVIPEFDTIFICRSSCWTPSWCDDYFLDFIDYLRIMYKQAWDRKVSLDYALRPRPFDIEAAKQYDFRFQRHNSTSDLGSQHSGTVRKFS